MHTKYGVDRKGSKQVPRKLGKVRWLGAFVVHLPEPQPTRARLRNFVLDENLVQELLVIVEFGWYKIIQIKV